jgi:hypothetical protein
MTTEIKSDFERRVQQESVAVDRTSSLLSTLVLAGLKGIRVIHDTILVDLYESDPESIARLEEIAATYGFKTEVPHGPKY